MGEEYKGMFRVTRGYSQSETGTDGNLACQEGPVVIDGVGGDVCVSRTGSYVRRAFRAVERGLHITPQIMCFLPIYKGNSNVPHDMLAI